MKLQIGDIVRIEVYDIFGTEIIIDTIEELITLTKEEIEQYPSLSEYRVLLKNNSHDEITFLQKIFLSKRKQKIYRSFKLGSAHFIERPNNFTATSLKNEEAYYEWLAKR